MYVLVLLILSFMLLFFYLVVDTCDGNAKILAYLNRLRPISVAKFCGFLSLCHKNARHNFFSQPHFNCSFRSWTSNGVTQMKKCISVTESEQTTQITSKFDEVLFLISLATLKYSRNFSILFSFFSSESKYIVRQLCQERLCLKSISVSIHFASDCRSLHV